MKITTTFSFHNTNRKWVINDVIITVKGKPKILKDSPSN